MHGKLYNIIVLCLIYIIMMIMHGLILFWHVAYMYTDFLEGVKAASGDFGCTHVSNHMFDVKAWLKPHTEPMYNHSHPHIFRFRKGPVWHSKTDKIGKLEYMVKLVADI